MGEIDKDRKEGEDEKWDGGAEGGRTRCGGGDEDGNEKDGG